MTVLTPVPTLHRTEIPIIDKMLLHLRINKALVSRRTWYNLSFNYKKEMTQVAQVAMPSTA